MPLWGNLIDRYGNRKLIVLVGMLLPLNAILFMFGQNFWYLMLVQFYNGFIFAGFEIITFNYLYDTTDEKNRPTWIAYYGVVNGITIFFGAMFGAFLMQWQYLLFTNYQVIFLASFLLRYVTTYIFVPRLQEVRRVKPISYKRLLWYLFSFHPRFRGV
jgi:MFS family permease